MLKPNRGEVAERLNEAVSQFTLTCSHGPIFVCFVSVTNPHLHRNTTSAVYCSASVQQYFSSLRLNFA